MRNYYHYKILTFFFSNSFIEKIGLPLIFPKLRCILQLESH